MVSCRTRALSVVVFCAMFSICRFGYSQSSLFELKVSNDKFVFQDKYFTSGLLLTFRTPVANTFLFKKKENNRLQLNLQLGQETYTPSNLWSYNTSDFDRPYAGWLFTSAEIGKITSNAAYFLGLETGVTGKASFAGQLQTAFHQFLSIMQPTWQDEIADKWLVNLKGKMVLNEDLNPWLSFHNNLSAALGSKDIFLQNQVGFSFGKFNTFQNSYRLQVFSNGQQNEYFGFIGFGYRYVLLNALIQGSAFGAKDAFTSVAEPHVVSSQVAFVTKVQRYVFKLEFQYNSKETPQSTHHVFGALTVGFFL